MQAGLWLKHSSHSFLHAMAAGAEACGSGLCRTFEKYAIGFFHPLAGPASKGSINFQPGIPGKPDFPFSDEVKELRGSNF